MASPQEIALKYTSPRAMELDLLDRYTKGTQYAERVDWFNNASNVPIVERAPCIKDPIVQSAVNSHVGFILGEGRWPTITSATSEDDRSLDEEWGLSKDDSDILDRFINIVLVRYVNLQLVAAEMLADAMKSRSSAVIISVQAGKLVAETVKAGWCTPTLDVHGAVKSIEIRYPYVETFYNDEKSKWEERCMLYRRVLDGISDTVYLPAKALETGKEPTWSVDKERTTENHGLGFCPVVWYPYRKPCSTADTIDGIAVHEYQLKDIDCLNIVLSQGQRAATIAGDPQVVETGVAASVEPAPLGRQSRGIVEQRPILGADGKPAIATMFTSTAGRGGSSGQARKRGAGVVWRYPDDKSKVGYLTIPADALKAVADHASNVRSKIAEAMHVVFINPKEIHTHSELSGKALAFLFQHQLSYCDGIRTDFGDKGLLALVSMLLRVSLVVGQKDIRALFVPGLKKVLPILERFLVEIDGDTKGGKAWMPPRMTNVWGPYFAPHEADQLAIVQTVVQALQGGVCTLEQAVEKLSTGGVFDISSAKEIAESITKERDENAAKEAAMLADSMSLDADHKAASKAGKESQTNPKNGQKPNPSGSNSKTSKEP